MNSAEQRQRLEAVKRKTRNASRILRLWIDGSATSNGIPGVTIVTTSRKECCRDCGDRRILYCWRTWPMICAWCSLARFENGGENPRKARRAEAAQESRGGA